jgi:hypothetical protein
MIHTCTDASSILTLAVHFLPTLNYSVRNSVDRVKIIKFGGGEDEHMKVIYIGYRLLL